MSDIIDHYQTLANQCEGKFTDRGSKFYSYVSPVTSLEEVEESLEDIRSKHPKSRHICYAYEIGVDGDIFRMNDDGEPSGSAGKPIYNCIRSAELADVIATVVRYFGGTKLGMSGLINAYKTATQYALEEAEIITKYITDTITMTYPMKDMGKMYEILKRLNISPTETSFDGNPSMTLEIPKSEIIKNIHLIKSNYTGYSTGDISVDYKVDGLQFENSEGDEW